MHIIKLFASMIYNKSYIYTIKFMNVYSSYEQIFNQNEGLHDKGNNEKIIGYKIVTLEGVIIK